MIRSPRIDFLFLSESCEAAKWCGFCDCVYEIHRIYKKKKKKINGEFEKSIIMTNINLLKKKKNWNGEFEKLIII